jgi:hypothetical protein
MLRNLLLAAATVATAWAGVASAATLDTVRQRGTLICGVSQGFAGFSTADSRGETRGFDADYCRAVAAAVLGDATKVRFVALTAQNRFTALQAGEIDVLFRNSTQTFLRGNSIGLQPASRELLRRPGLRRPPRRRRGPGAGPQRRHCLRGPGHDARAEPGRHRARAEHPLPAGRLRAHRHDVLGLLARLHRRAAGRSRRHCHRQNFGPHIEQKCATLWASFGSVSS